MRFKVIKTDNFKGLFSVERVSETIAERIKDLRKISRIDPDMKEKIAYLIKLAIRINRQEWYSIGLDGYRYEDIKFPEMFDWMLYPSKVTITNDLSANDLILRDIYNENDYNVVYDPDKVIRFTERIYGHFKEAGRYVLVSDKRNKVLLNDIMWTVNDSQEGWVMHANDNTVGWPIPVKSYVGQVYGKDYLLDKAWGQMGEFIVTNKLI
jgi:hypothetical protein